MRGHYQHITKVGVEEGFLYQSCPVFVSIPGCLGLAQTSWLVWSCVALIWVMACHTLKPTGLPTESSLASHARESLWVNVKWRLLLNSK